MAFYSSTVDEAGNEILRASSAREHSSQGMTERTAGHSSHLMTDRTRGRSFRDLNSSTASHYRTVRYVNPAAFVEKSPDINTSEVISSDSNKLISTAVSSDIVPRLDFNSEDNSPSVDDLSYSYRKVCEVPKIIVKPDAYANWLSAKRKTKSYEAEEKKKAEERKQQQLAEKRRLADEKFQEWLASKSVPRRNIKHQQDQGDYLHMLTEEEARSNRRAWEKKKQEEERHRRMETELQEKQKQLFVEKRKMMATQSWEKWLSEASTKPKPVPLNRGIFTLKGTISDIYINPNTWKDPSIVEEN